MAKPNAARQIFGILVAGHHLAPHALGLEPLEGEREERGADLASQTHRPHRRVDAPAHFDKALPLHDEKTVAVFAITAREYFELAY